MTTRPNSPSPLREDVTFSDGAPLTAEVVAANFDPTGKATRAVRSSFPKR